MEFEEKSKNRTTIGLYLGQSLRYYLTKIHKAAQSTQECEKFPVVLKESLIISISAAS